MHNQNNDQLQVLFHVNNLQAYLYHKRIPQSYYFWLELNLTTIDFPSVTNISLPTKN